jgi:hypothetical protein
VQCGFTIDRCWVVKLKTCFAIVTEIGDDGKMFPAFSLFLLLKKDFFVRLKQWDIFQSCTRHTSGQNVRRIPTKTFPSKKGIQSFSSFFYLIKSLSIPNPLPNES